MNEIFAFRSPIIIIVHHIYWMWFATRNSCHVSACRELIRGTFQPRHSTYYWLVCSSDVGMDGAHFRRFGTNGRSIVCNEKEKKNMFRNLFLIYLSLFIVQKTIEKSIICFFSIFIEFEIIRKILANTFKWSHIVDCLRCSLSVHLSITQIERIVLKLSNRSNYLSLVLWLTSRVSYAIAFKHQQTIKLIIYRWYPECEFHRTCSVIYCRSYASM